MRFSGLAGGGVRRAFRPGEFVRLPLRRAKAWTRSALLRGHKTPLRSSEGTSRCPKRYGPPGHDTGSAGIRSTPQHPIAPIIAAYGVCVTAVLPRSHFRGRIRHFVARMTGRWIGRCRGCHSEGPVGGCRGYHVLRAPKNLRGNNPSNGDDRRRSFPRRQRPQAGTTDRQTRRQGATTTATATGTAAVAWGKDLPTCSGSKDPPPGDSSGPGTRGIHGDGRRSPQNDNHDDDHDDHDRSYGGKGPGSSRPPPILGCTPFPTAPWDCTAMLSRSRPGPSAGSPPLAGTARGRSPSRRLRPSSGNNSSG